MQKIKKDLFFLFSSRLEQQACRARIRIPDLGVVAETGGNGQEMVGVFRHFLRRLQYIENEKKNGPSVTKGCLIDGLNKQTNEGYRLRVIH